MRRLLLAVVLLGLVVTLGLLTMPSVPAAQEATPSGEAAPVTLETLGSAPATDLVRRRIKAASTVHVLAH